MKNSVYLAVVLLLGLLPGAFAQRQVRFSLETAVLDLTNSFAQPGKVAIPLAPTNANLEITDWAAAKVSTNHQAEFLLKLKAPTTLGSVLAYGAGAISFLSDGEWKALPATVGAKGPLQLIPFPALDLVEAIKVQVPAKPINGKIGTYQATLPFLTLIPVRAINLAPAARVTASSAGEASNGAKEKLDPQMVVDGIIHPQRNFVTARPPEDARDHWLLLSWKEPKSFRGISIFRGGKDEGFGESITEIYTADGNPADSKEASDWKKVEGRATLPGAFRQNQFFVSFEGQQTRGLRIRSLGGVDQIAVGEIVVLHDLGYAPPPEARHSGPPEEARPVNRTKEDRTGPK